MPTLSAARRTLAALGLLLPLACGDNRAIINVDLDSFIAEEDRRFAYLVLPAGLHTATSPIESVETPAGLRDVATLEGMTADLQIRLDNRAVLGEITMGVQLEVFVAADDDPLHFWDAEHRLAVLSGELRGGNIDFLEERFAAGDFLPLFREHETVYVGLRFALEHRGGTGAIDGEALVTGLDLRIEARESLF